MKDTQEKFLSKAAECQHLDASKKKIRQILFYKLLQQAEKTELKRKYSDVQKDKSIANDYKLKKNKTQNDELPKNQGKVKIELSKTSHHHRHSDSSSGSTEDKFDIGKYPISDRFLENFGQLPRKNLSNGQPAWMTALSLFFIIM